MLGSERPVSSYRVRIISPRTSKTTAEKGTPAHVPGRPRKITRVLTTGKYSTITGTSPASTTRDLADLVAKGGLVREGERRHTRYPLRVPFTAGCAGASGALCASCNTRSKR